MPKGVYTRTVELALIRALKWFLNRAPCGVPGCLELCPRNRRTYCEKHYYRKRRTGTTNQRISRVCNDGKYSIEYMPGHPLADKQGLIRQHRRVLYDKIGEGPHECSWCGVEVTWKILHTDHLDGNGFNNEPNNLVPACKDCNRQRGHMIAFLKRCEAWKLEKEK